MNELGRKDPENMVLPSLRQFRMLGIVIGSALEPLAKGTGEILVLLNLQ